MANSSTQALRRYIGLIVVGGIFYWILVTYQPLIAPLIISGLIAYILNPLVGMLRKRTKWGQTLASSVIFLLFLLLIYLIVSILIPVLISQVTFITEQIETFPAQVIQIQADLEAFLGISLPIEDLLSDIQLEAEGLFEIDRLFRVLLAATANAVWVLVIIVASYYLLRDWERLRNWVFNLLPVDLQDEARIIYRKLGRVWATYLRGQVLMMVLIGTLSTIGGLIAGLGGAVLIGILAGALALIPTLGPATATLIAGLVAYSTGSSYLNISNLWFAILVVAIFTGIQTLEGIWFQPLIMSRRLKIHPGLILVAVVSTIATLGALAGLIVVPVLGSADEMLRFYLKRRDDQG
ncbi:MAG: AI-2E family transporter [Anaerolineae bacterium]|nr:AI-2E family transporter [Anaerolineae bacterium]